MCLDNDEHRCLTLGATCVFARRVQALVLSPTRELAAQTEKNILALGEFLKVQAHCCIGGKSLGARLRPCSLWLRIKLISGCP